MALLPAPAPADADPVFGPLLASFLACVCAELTAVGRAPCECCMVWGDTPPPADFCDCDCAGGGHGQAWVRLVQFDPVPDVERRGTARCQAMRERAWIEAGVYRCAPVTGPDGVSPPTCQDRTDTAWGMLQDARALRRAVACCQALRDRPLELVTQQPLGIRGGCTGVTIQFTLEP